MQRRFEKNELVLLLNPERNGFTPVIYLDSMEDEIHKVMDTETGDVWHVIDKRLAKVQQEEEEEDT